MVFDNLYSENNYLHLENNLVKCLEFARENSLANFEVGRYELDGNNIFVNIVAYDTVEKEERIWEAHKEYIDIHIMLIGKEKILLNSIDNMEQGEYKKSEDFLPLHGEDNGCVELNTDNFLICYPQDAHMTAVKVNESEKVKKAIFKVRI